VHRGGVEGARSALRAGAYSQSHVSSRIAWTRRRFQRSTDDALAEANAANLGAARAIIAQWVAHDNEERLHAVLGYLTPAELIAVIPRRASRTGDRSWHVVGRSGPDQSTAAGASRVVGEVSLSDERPTVGLL
jgi:hypothetical protein